MLEQNHKLKEGCGIALGGGAVLGAFHIGVLKFLDEQRLKITHIAGTSIGALIGALYAAGLSVEEIENELSHISWSDLSSWTLPKMGLMTNTKVKSLLKKHIGHDSFAELKLPFIAIATDITTGEEVVLKDGSLSEAIMASMSIPGIFQPVEINGRLLVDGGVIDNVPILPLKEMGAEKIIGVDLDAKHSADRPSNTIEVLMNTFQFMLAGMNKTKHHLADIVLQPDLRGYSRVSTKQVKELIELGYHEAKKTIK